MQRPMSASASRDRLKAPGFGKLPYGYHRTHKPVPIDGVMRNGNIDWYKYGGAIDGYVAEKMRETFLAPSKNAGAGAGGEEVLSVQFAARAKNNWFAAALQLKLAENLRKKALIRRPLKTSETRLCTL